MIDDMNINHKVGIIAIYLRDENRIDIELMDDILSRFSNVHKIWIVDELNAIDHQFY